MFMFTFQTKTRFVQVSNSDTASFYLGFIGVYNSLAYQMIIYVPVDWP